MQVKVKHPHIVSHKDFYDGRPIIKGTKFPVRSVVVYILKQGMSPEEVVREFPHLTLAQIYDALSFYYDHQEEIEKDLALNTEINRKQENRDSYHFFSPAKVRSERF